MTQIFLFKPAGWFQQYFPDPGNWNPVNTVECIGSGGKGANAGGIVRENLEAVLGDIPGPPPLYYGGGGGGGGDYAVGSNIVPDIWPAPYSVMHGESTGGWCTIFNHEASPSGITIPNQVCARQGYIPAGAPGGPPGNFHFPAGFSGGTGGTGANLANSCGAGGGGAAGPNGAGSVGGLGGVGVFGVGGAGDAGFGGAGGATAGAVGGTGTQWDATHGCGGGGAGGDLLVGGGIGGNYGAGGGGGCAALGVNIGGIGGDGLIILTYTPVVLASGPGPIVIM